MTYAWLLQGLDRDVRDQITRTLYGQEPKDEPTPEQAQAENARTFGALMGMATKGAR